MCCPGDADRRLTRNCALLRLEVVRSDICSRENDAMLRRFATEKLERFGSDERKTLAQRSQVDTLLVGQLALVVAIHQISHLLVGVRRQVDQRDALDPSQRCVNCRVHRPISVRGVSVHSTQRTRNPRRLTLVGRPENFFPVGFGPHTGHL